MENYKCLELKNGYGLGIATEVDRVPDWHEDFKRQRKYSVEICC